MLYINIQTLKLRIYKRRRFCISWLKKMQTMILHNASQ